MSILLNPSSLAQGKERIKYTKDQLLALKDAPLSKRKPDLPVAELLIAETENSVNKSVRRGSRGATRGRGKHEPRNKGTWQTSDVQKSDELEKGLNQEESSRRKEFEEFRKQYNNYKPTTSKQEVSNNTTTTAPASFINISEIPSEEDLLAHDFLIDDLLLEDKPAPAKGSKLLKFMQPEKATPVNEVAVHPILQMIQPTITQQQTPPPSGPVFQDVDALEAELLKGLANPQPAPVQNSFNVSSFFMQYQAQPPFPPMQHQMGHTVSYAKATAPEKVTSAPISIPAKQQPIVQDKISESPPKPKRLVPAQTIKAKAAKQIPQGKPVHVNQLFAAIPQNYQPAPANVPMRSIEDIEKEFLAQ